MKSALVVAEAFHGCRDSVFHLPCVGFLECFETKHAFRAGQCQAHSVETRYHPRQGFGWRPPRDFAHHFSRFFFQVDHRFHNCTASGGPSREQHKGGTNGTQFRKIQLRTRPFRLPLVLLSANRNLAFMIGTIRKHQTWLWAVIITLTIISFVWYFGPSSKMSDARRGPANYGSINGERINQADFEE